MSSTRWPVHLLATAIHISPVQLPLHHSTASQPSCALLKWEVEFGGNKKIGGNGVSEFSPGLEMYNSWKEKRERVKESKGIFSLQNFAESWSSSQMKLLREKEYGLIKGCTKIWGCIAFLTISRWKLLVRKVGKQC